MADFESADGVTVARELIPTRVRKALYVLLWMIGLALTAVGIWCANMGIATPDWLPGATAVGAFLLIPFGQLAAANVPTPAPVAIVATDPVAGLADEGLSDEGLPG